MSFARPWLLLLLLAIPWWLWYRRRRRSSGAAYSDVSLVDGATTGAWILALPPALRALTLAVWIVAAAGPRSGGTTIEQKKEGIAIVVAIDISSSMLA
ncbi:MAG: BatA domain-containing protein, partial [Gemmatimonadota bacterium]